MSLSAIEFDGSFLRLLDQRKLPSVTSYVNCSTASETAAAITAMVVRGAPAIGITAAYGMAMAQKNGEDLEKAEQVLIYVLIFNFCKL